MRTTLARLARVCEATALVLLLGACSTVPEFGLPPQREGHVEVVYEFEADGAPIRVPVPASGRELTILELTADPPAAREAYVDGRRFLVPPPGATALRIACRYVVYGQPGADDPFASAPRILDAFPGARLVGATVQD